MAGILQRTTIDDFDYVSCPVGGAFYLCADVNYLTFLGCCDANPCSGRMCSADDLWPMGFGKKTSPAPDYPNHSCPYGGLWYTCADNDTPFQGCCISDPCNGEGCPTSDLLPAAVHTVEVAGGSTFTVPATLSLAAFVSSSVDTESSQTSNDVTTDYFQGTTASMSTGSTQCLTTSSYDDDYWRTPKPTSSETGTSTASRTAAIAGGTVAVTVVLAVLIGLAVFFYKRRSKQQKPSPKIALAPVAPDTDAKSLPQTSAIGANAAADTGPFFRANAPMVPASSSAPVPLPTYSMASSKFPSGIPLATMSSFVHGGPNKSDSMVPSEIMGTELSEQEYQQRTMSRMLGTGLEEPIELAAGPIPAGERNSDLRSVSFISRPHSGTGITGYSGQSLRESTATGGLPIGAPRLFSGYPSP